MKSKKCEGFSLGEKQTTNFYKKKRRKISAHAESHAQLQNDLDF
jgi:hypothetical protein